jgi:creatinine amidohydrolase/Fe(II)-dependent formamide hydrolase-like protein
LAVATAGLIGSGVCGPAPQTLLSNMTSMQVARAVKDGFATVLIPTGGIEQNGPHMVLGKHDFIVEAAAREVANTAGRTLVTPVVSFVPQGRFDPPEGHLRFAGTLGLSDETFAAVLTDLATSLKLHGFTLICFLGDHGGSQAVQAQVANDLTARWKKDGVRVANLDAYYNDAEQRLRLIAEGETPDTIGDHAGLLDTSELLAVHPQGVDLALARVGAAGSSGDPGRATANRGKALIAMRIGAAVRQLNRLRERE